MIDKLKLFFDAYSLHARVLPSLFLIAPIIINAFILIPFFHHNFNFCIEILLTLGFISFISNKVASIGRNKQSYLFKKWGGSPSIQYLRHNNNYLDKYTVRRYHKWINQKIQNLTMPSEIEENTNPTKSDEKYESATRWLREYTRNIKHYPLVFKELTLYGFARNVWGVKFIGMSICTLALLFSFLYIYSITNGNLSLWIRAKFIAPLFIPIVYLLIWIFMINTKWVFHRGLAYARALTAVCETPGNETTQ